MQPFAAAVLLRYADDCGPGVRFVKLLPHALPTRYDPSAEDSREIAAGRLLLLSGSPETPPISALEMRRSRAAAHAFRRNCLAMNDIGAVLCATTHYSLPTNH